MARGAIPVAAGAAAGFATGVAVVQWRFEIDGGAAAAFWPVAVGGAAAASLTAWMLARRAPAAERQGIWRVVALAIPCGAGFLGLASGIAAPVGKGHPVGEVVASGLWTMVLAAVASVPTAAVTAFAWWLATRTRR